MGEKSIKAMVFYLRPSPILLLEKNIRIAIVPEIEIRSYSKGTTYLFVGCSDISAIEILKTISIYEGIRHDGLMFYSINKPLDMTVNVLRETNLIDC